MTHVALSLGSNINKEKNITDAVNQIKVVYGELEISPVYETSSVGFTGPSFFNLVVGLYTDDSVDNIRKQLRKIEAKAGRIRGPKAFSSRVLDIDIILYGKENLIDQGYNIPRDEIEKYAYVLKPLSELYPYLKHPVSGKTMEDMWKEFEVENQTLTVADFAL